METETQRGDIPTPFKTEEAYREAEKKVVYPDTDVNEIQFGETTIRLRPLPAARQQMLVTLAAPLVDKFSSGGFQSGVEQVIPTLIKAVTVLGEFYRVPGCTEAWVGDTFDDGEMFDIVQAQISKGTTNSFLRRGLRPLLLLAQEIFEGIEVLDPGKVKQLVSRLVKDLFEEDSGETPPSSAASASPGVADLESLQNGTPGVS